MKIQLVGGSYQERSLPFDAQRSINLYPVADPQGADTAALYGTPGLEEFEDLGADAIRGCFRAANERAFAISGSSFYEIFSNGTSTLRGTLDTGTGAITMADNGFQLGICDGEFVYMFTYASNIFARVTDADLPLASGISFIDGYFIIAEKDAGKFYISGLYDGTSWDSLDFASAESSPDQLVRATNFVGQLGLFGTNTLEIWRNTGDATFPFSRISGATQIGTISPYTVLSLDTSVFWVGNNDQGFGIVYKAQGFSPIRISTSPIEKILQAVSQPQDLRAWTYQEDGHVFYCITGSDLPTTLVYDLSTQLWHERAYLNTGNLEQHLGISYMNAFNKHIIGSRIDGKLYEMSLDTYSDAGNPLLRRRVYTHLIDELKPIRYSELKIGFETGVGLQSGQGSDPLVSLRISKDGARTWGDSYTTGLGAVGKYQAEASFRRLGIARQCTFEISVSDPVKVAITGSYLR